jgi:hypothetical protein
LTENRRIAARGSAVTSKQIVAEPLFNLIVHEWSCGRGTPPASRRRSGPLHPFPQEDAMPGRHAALGLALALCFATAGCSVDAPTAPAAPDGADVAAVAAPTGEAMFAVGPSSQACWGQASKVFAQTGTLGEHSRDQTNPRAGLRNLARQLYMLGVIPDDTMQALGAFVASALGLDIDACM